MIDILRNMTRRKVRTGLTVLGIIIGVFALTVMGAMAEKMNLLVGGGLAYYGDHVTVTQAGADMSGMPISMARAADLRKVPGVAAVVPVVQLPLKTDGSVGFGMPDMITGTGANAAGHDASTLVAAQGTIPSLSQRGVIAVGSAIAGEYKLHVGETFMVRGEPFVVKAILQTTMTVPDSMVRMNLRDAQNLLLKDLPPLLRGSIQPDQLASAFAVYPRSGISGDVLAARIEHAGISDIKVLSPSAMKAQFQQLSTTFNLITLGSALIALIVGTLSVINTMATSVAERIKEIGLKKAIGARTGQVLREFLSEAAAIGLVGGLIGLGLGSLLVGVINADTAHTGAQIFIVTTRLAVGTVLFATLLGVAAGFFPALKAAWLNPVDALRAE
ncbi:MAG TPA: ABC transporter permease [Chloroflexota bacterium]|nr:ABC transporter permease [Chloroflexota bacterium]